MSAETFTTAMFLITAVIAAGVLINAVLPVIYTAAGSFSESSHESDLRLRTDFKIVTAVVNNSYVARIWMKNTGSERIPITDIERSDVICGDAGDFGRLSLTAVTPLPAGTWSYTLSDLNRNSNWDSGETLEIDAKTPTITGKPIGTPVYFQFVLPNGIWRSTDFTV
ncbi:MAG: flagellin [Methanoregula sp.]